PKSIVHSGNGRFFAQNMMYRHSVTVYDRNYTLLKTINDKVNPQKLGRDDLPTSLEGSPVEVAFDREGTYAYVSNYKMYGKGYNNPGQDNCVISETYDQSFVYKINTRSLEIESMIEVGSVPKFLSVSPNGKTLLVSNWCSGDLSVIDLETEEEIRRIKLGKYPRGIAIDSKSSFAYISIMGEDEIAVLNLLDYSMNWMNAHGKTPRHVILDPSDRFLYVSLSREGEVAKIDLVKRELVKKINTGKEARSITLSGNANYLYVVNYEDDKLSKIATDSMVVLEDIKTHEKPIGITFDEETQLIWVACYTGSIMIFEDDDLREDEWLEISSESSPAEKNPAVRQEKRQRPKSFYYVPRKRQPVDPTYYVYRDKNFEESQPELSPKKTDTKKLNQPPKKQLAEKERKQKNPSNARLPELALNRALETYSYHVIVGSYQNDRSAQKKAKELSKDGYDTKVLPNEQGGFRVSAGNYSAKETASKAAKNFRKKTGIQAWVLKK
ncbi:MAG: beta-propeller fold lactonase family protein, partial [Bacteroidota bacterium]